MDFNELLRTCEEHVRAGRADRVGAQLSAIELAKLPRALRLPFARLCRRASLISLGLKILSPIVRNERDLPAPAEVAEYSVLLQRTGAVHEALRRLKSLNHNTVPEAALFQAFCHFNLWDYAAAIAPLQSYLRSPLDPYAQLVGQVNLAAAWIAIKELDKAAVQIEDNIKLARTLNATRLEGNCLELMAQVHVGRGELGQAKEKLAEAGRILLSENTLDALFVRKWLAIVDGLENQSTASLLEVQNQARKFGDSETVRETDFYLLKVNFESERFHHLMFGTPFARYRARLCEEFPNRPLDAKYRIGNADSAKVVDLTRGTCSTDTNFAAGKKVHQLLSALLSDFYRPLRMGDLFARLYADEYFDPFTSPGRVAQVISRARHWLSAAGIEAQIQIENGAFTLRLDPQAAFLVAAPDERKKVDVNHCLLERASQEFTDARLFSSGAACARLGLSETSFKRFARWGIENGTLERIGSGRGTSYRLKMAR